MDALYQQQILALAKSVRDSKAVAHPTHEALVSNPTCGDRVHITLAADNQTIITAGAAVRGCALCEAGAGLLLDMAPGMAHHEAMALRAAFSAWLAGDDNAPIEARMQMFEPVRSIKGRHKCVTLAFDAAFKALDGKAGTTGS